MKYVYIILHIYFFRRLNNFISPFRVLTPDCIVVVMVSMLTSCVVDYGFEARSCQTKDHKIGICYFSAKQSVRRRKNKDWLARNQDNVFEWGDMSIRGLLFQ